MLESKVYLLRIMEGARCVAEAPLIVHDKEAARRCWLEAFGQIAQGVTGATFQMVMLACAEQEPPVPVAGIELKGEHSGIKIAHRIPSRNGPEAPA